MWFWSQFDRREKKSLPEPRVCCTNTPTPTSQEDSILQACANYGCFPSFPQTAALSCLNLDLDISGNLGQKKNEAGLKIITAGDEFHEVGTGPITELEPLSHFSKMS